MDNRRDVGCWNKERKVGIIPNRIERRVRKVRNIVVHKAYRIVPLKIQQVAVSMLYNIV